MLNVLHRKMCVNDGFGISKLVISTQDEKEEGRQRTWKIAKKFEDVQLQALLDDDDSQTQKQSTKQLGVDQQAVFNRLREMEKIQRTNKWVPRELNNRQMEKRKNSCDILLAWFKRKYNYWGWKMDLFWEFQAQEIKDKARRTINIDRKTESFY